jgi:hypothetical protein
VKLKRKRSRGIREIRGRLKMRGITKNTKHTKIRRRGHREARRNAEGNVNKPLINANEEQRASSKAPCFILNPLTTLEARFRNP